MKSTLLIATVFTSTLLSACGSQLPGQAFRQPAQIGRAAQPTRMPQLVRAQNFQAKYANLILKTEYSPDVNGMQFGFDFGHVSFISMEGKMIDLDMRYSARGRILWASLLEQGAPQEQREHVDQKNRARLAELARELRALGAGSPEDRANIERIARLFENPPVRP